MLLLYAACVGDLKPGDFVIVECALCGHNGLIHPGALPSLGFGPNERIVDLAPRIRCRECDQKGKAVVSINSLALAAVGVPVLFDPSLPALR
jgi:hypothetical protein